MTGGWLQSEAVHYVMTVFSKPLFSTAKLPKRTVDHEPDVKVKIKLCFVKVKMNYVSPFCHTGR